MSKRAVPFWASILLLAAVFISGSPVIQALAGAHYPSAQGATAADAAMEAAYFYSYLESVGDYNTEYDYIHPDARAVIPRAAVVGWFLDNYWTRQPGPAVISGVRFISWTWEVTGVTYPNTAEVSFSQTFWDGGRNTVQQDVVRLVQDRNGVWRWFFGRSMEFVQQTIRMYVPAVPDVPRSGLPSIDQTVNDMDIYWIGFFSILPDPYASPLVVPFDSTVSSACGVAYSMVDGPFYCGLDETIYLDVRMLEEWLFAFGPFPVQMVVAHEWAHHVQNELGLLGGSVLDAELQADCLAGDWSRNFATRYAITESDLIAAMNLMITIGGDPDHGPGTLRTKEFLTGFYDGSQACFY